MKYFSVPTGVSTFSEPSLFRGRLPKTIVLGLIKSESRHGDYKQNAFFFDNFSVNKIQLLKDEVSVGIRNGLQPNYGTQYQFAEAYMNLLINTGMMDRGCKFEMINFQQGFSLYAYNLSDSEPMSLVNSFVNGEGNLRLDINFTTAPTKPLEVIVWAIYDGIMTIDENRTVTMG